MARIIPHGWEWPGRGQRECGAKAEDRSTGRSIACNLRAGHHGVHHWEEVDGRLLLSASWIATGPVTYIGAGTDA